MSKLNTTVDKKYNFRRLDPLPSKEEVDEIYREKFANTKRPRFLENKERDREFWKNAHLRKKKTVEKILKSKTIKNEKRKILDIGCGVGQILEDFRLWGWDVFGIEPSKAFDLTLKEKNIPFSNQFFGSISQEKMDKWGKFDFINMTNFLEHVLEPVKLVKIAKTMLKPGGVLCIESPNDFNDLQVVAYDKLKVDAWWINQLHVNYFNKTSLETIMKDIGLLPVTSSAQFPMELFLLFGLNYINDGDIGKECHQMRVNFETTLHENNSENLLINLYEKLADIGIGRIISVYGRRNENE